MQENKQEELADPEYDIGYVDDANVRAKCNRCMAIGEQIWSVFASTKEN